MVFIKTVSRIYLILALLMAVLFSPLHYSVIALILLILQIYCIYKPYGAGLNLVLIVSTLFIMPLTLKDPVGELFAELLVIPAIPLLDNNLKEYALKQDFHPSEGRRPTTLLTTLSIAVITVLVLSLILAKWTLSLTSVLLSAYLLAILVYVLYGIPKFPLLSSATTVRIIVGETSKISLAINSTAKLALHTLFTSPDSWVSLNPDKLTIGELEAEMNIALTPPLSGPSQPQLQVYMTDPWGLIQMNQSLTPIEMHVIPRSRYAAWLARRFLGQAMLHAAPTVMATSSSASFVATKRGVEYLNSRTYQPGDRLKDIDWKHMYKLNELVVKEYTEAKGLFTIIAVNLTVNDAEEADKLIYNLITLALTLAKAGVPLALVAYNHQEVVSTTEAVEPREILKKALNLEQDIVIVEPLQRFLQPQDVRGLRRTMTQLEQVKTEPAKRITEFLRFENEAIYQRAKNHPAVQAITKVTERVHAPATIAVVSGWNHDAEALLVILDKLDRRGYNILPIDSDKGDRRLLKTG